MVKYENDYQKGNEKDGNYENDDEYEENDVWLRCQLGARGCLQLAGWLVGWFGWLLKQSTKSEN